MKPRKILAELTAICAGLALLYGVAYLVSVRKFDGYCGSAPINDPLWSITVDASPGYRFLPAIFWAPAHRLDRFMRPRYWEYTVRASGGVVLSNSPGTVVFTLPPPPLLERVFPTLGGD